ncbi:MAG: acyltransferase domain-containing protein [Vicinamibacterales bacterium]
MPNVILFPGQSSADPRALSRARRAHPAAAQVAAEAAAVLGAGDADRYLHADTAPLATNRDVQIVVFVASQMYLRALAEEGVAAETSLGLSLGEYSHLVHIGALDFASALALVSERGRCYDEAPPGVMVTVLGADRDAVEQVVAAGRAHGPVVVSNYNARTQHVVAGAAGAVAWVAHELEEAHGAHTVEIEPRVPMHSPLMTGVAARLRRVLEAAPWMPPAFGYRPNVTAGSIPPRACRADTFVALLERHVSEPVRWDASVDAVVAACPGATFVEVGPGVVLHNLLGRAWRRVPRAHVDAPDGADPAAHFRRLLETLCARA